VTPTEFRTVIMRKQESDAERNAECLEHTDRQTDGIAISILRIAFIDE